MTDSLINRSCLSCASCGCSTHRHGRTSWICRRFGFDIDASTVPGETISCDRFEPSTMLALAAKEAEMPDYLL